MLSNLNEKQREAVLAVEGPVMVFAGAGSGKTRTLTYRVAYMIDQKKIKPYHILAITFTNKATNEMKDRLLNLVGTDSYDVTISTFHSLCARILRREIHLLGYERSFNIIDEDEQLKIVNEVLKENNIDKKQYPGKHVQKKINYCKCFNTKPDDPIEKKIMNLYEEKMKSLNLLDFEDLLLKIHEIFSSYPDVLNKYAHRYQYILVDEFQDTNLIQYEIVKLLAKNNRNIFVVGDDDQSIYSFRGTNYENMNLFKKDFPEYQIFYLTQNYRSTQTILEGCNRLISNNQYREKKELFSKEIGSQMDVQIYQAPNEKIEVDYILDQIFSLKLKGAEYTDFAVLYRNSVLLRNLEIGLIQAGLPYQVFGGVSYLRRREIKDVIAYFKLMVNPNDTYSFTRIVNVPSRLLGEATINKVLEIKKKYRLTLFAAIDACQTILSQKRYETLMEFKNMIIELQQLMENENLIVVYEKLLELTKYRDYLMNEDDSTDRLENIEEFKSILLQIEEDNRPLTRLEKLEEAFDQAILADDKLQNQRQDRQGITLSTIHSVKGLEFAYVFVIGLEENVFPNIYRFTSEDELEEERRIAYVAFTRAKKRLYLLSSQNRLLYGERFSNRTSRFLLEFMGVNQSDETLKEFNQEPLFINQDNNSANKKIKLLSDDERPKYNIGDKVVHNKFGNGIIIAIDGDIGQIFFDQEKKLTKIMLSHPALQKK